MPISRGVTANGDNAIPSIHIPGSYEYWLQLRCWLDGRDHYWALRQEASNPLLDEAHKIVEAERIAALVEERRGEPVYVNRQVSHFLRGLTLPPDADAQRSRFPNGVALPAHWRGAESFTVTPDDVVTVRHTRVAMD